MGSKVFWLRDEHRLKGKCREGDWTACRHPPKSRSVEGGSVYRCFPLELGVVGEGLHRQGLDGIRSGCLAEATERGCHPGDDGVTVLTVSRHVLMRGTAVTVEVMQLIKKEAKTLTRGHILRNNCPERDAYFYTLWLAWRTMVVLLIQHLYVF